LAKDSPSQSLEQLKFQNYELGNTANLYPIYINGLAELRLHHGREAAAEFQKMLDHRNIISASPLANLAQLGLARSLAIQGDTAAAKTAYRTFLSAWYTADPDLPVLLQAKSECARLHCSTAN
jgi:eukaryotic-like serine/threonine-protein kinase